MERAPDKKGEKLRNKERKGGRNNKIRKGKR
jgi:hypothetical protein